MSSQGGRLHPYHIFIIGIVSGGRIHPYHIYIIGIVRGWGYIYFLIELKYRYKIIVKENN